MTTLARVLAIASICALALVTAGVARAADKGAPAGSPAMGEAAPHLIGRWTGPYIGAALGTAVGDFGADGIDIASNGYTGSVLIGYSHQADRLVVGVEIDATLTNMRGSIAGGMITHSGRWNATARGRLGVAFGGVLPFLTAGYAYGRDSIKAGDESDSATRQGWVYGAGLEALITRTMAIRVEAMQIDWKDATFFDTSTSATERSARLGMTFKLN